MPFGYDSLEWLHVGGIKLTTNDRNSIMREERLNMIINAAQKLLKVDFQAKIKGLNSILLQATKNLNACVFEENKVQIIRSRGNHWIIAATEGDEQEKTVKVYDSLYNNIDDGTCSNIFGSLGASCHIKTLKQSEVDDCGLHPVAYAPHICHGQDPIAMNFDQSLIRLH